MTDKPIEKAPQGLVDPNSTREIWKYAFKLVASVLFAIPVVVVGGLLCATGMFIMVGLPVLWYGCKPLMLTNKTRVNKLIEWKFRDKTEVVEKPWKM